MRAVAEPGCKRKSRRHKAECVRAWGRVLERGGADNVDGDLDLEAALRVRYGPRNRRVRRRGTRRRLRCVVPPSRGGRHDRAVFNAYTKRHVRSVKWMHTIHVY
jgi:hypothetical protein